MLSASKSGTYKETVAKPLCLYVYNCKAKNNERTMTLLDLCNNAHARRQCFQFSNPIPLTAPWEINPYEI